MRARNYYIKSLSDIDKAINAVRIILTNGKTKVVICDAGTKSSKQRGLEWIWYNDIAKAGVGGSLEETAEGVHVACKARFTVAILMRDDDLFCGVYTEFMKRHGEDVTMRMKFIDQMVHTEKLSVSQMAENLTAIKQYYLPHGVNLTEPSFKGLLEWIENQSDNERGE